MPEKINRFYWKEIVGTFFWIALVYFLVREDGWDRCLKWLEKW